MKNLKKFNEFLDPMGKWTSGDNGDNDVQNPKFTDKNAEEFLTRLGVNITKATGEYRYHGLSVIIRNENEFNHIKKFLGEDVLYLDFLPQMSTTETAIVIWSDRKDFSPGSVGSSEYQKKHFFRLVEFSDFFKIAG